MYFLESIFAMFANQGGIFAMFANQGGTFAMLTNQVGTIIEYRGKPPIHVAAMPPLRRRCPYCASYVEPVKDCPHCGAPA